MSHESWATYVTTSNKTTGMQLRSVFLPYQAVSLLKVTRIFKTFSTQEVQLDPKDGEWLKCWGVEDPVLHGAPPMALKDEPHMRVWKGCREWSFR